MFYVSEISVSEGFSSSLGRARAFSHRAIAAKRAISLRRSGEIFRRRALVPNRPNLTAAGSFLAIVFNGQRLYAVRTACVVARIRALRTQQKPAGNADFLLSHLIS